MFESFQSCLKIINVIFQKNLGEDGSQWKRTKRKSLMHGWLKTEGRVAN
jgi:hypothetical protein